MVCRVEVLNDLWMFDLKSEMWTELEPLGVPCARLNMGKSTSPYLPVTVF